MAVERLRRGELNSALFSKTAIREQSKVNMVSVSVPTTWTMYARMYTCTYDTTQNVPSEIIAGKLVASGCTGGLLSIGSWAGNAESGTRGGQSKIPCGKRMYPNHLDRKYTPHTNALSRQYSFRCKSLTTLRSPLKTYLTHSGAA